jgi:hypothetical protein
MKVYSGNEWLARQMLDMMVERAWFSLLLEDSKKASRKAAMLEQQDEIMWIENQLEDEDMNEWLDMGPQPKRS